MRTLLVIWSCKDRTHEHATEKEAAACIAKYEAVDDLYAAFFRVHQALEKFVASAGAYCDSESLESCEAAGDLIADLRTKGVVPDA